MHQIEAAKSHFMERFNVRRHVANEVALEYERFLDLSDSRLVYPLKADSLLWQFAAYVAEKNQTEGQDGVPIDTAQFAATYQHRYGQPVPACWLAGSLDHVRRARDAAPTGQDARPTGQMEANELRALNQMINDPTPTVG